MESSEILWTPLKSSGILLNPLESLWKPCESFQMLPLFWNLGNPLESFGILAFKSLGEPCESLGILPWKCLGSPWKSFESPNMPIISYSFFHKNIYEKVSPLKTLEIKSMNIHEIFSEIHRNREFYRTNDVRPPFTYASLIRQVSFFKLPIWYWKTRVS